MSLANLLTRARHVLSAYDPTGRRTLMQATGMANEKFQGIELLLPYGFSALPMGNTADVVILQMNGHRDHKVGLGADDPALRITDLQPGEFGLRDMRGQQVVLRRNRIEITAAGGNPVVITGDLHVSGAVIAGYGGNDQVTVQNHTHGGVQTGAGHTQKPDAGT